ncbi:MAG: methyltransferase domain-containing protein [Candidatus Kapabacteria bacterium]|jgi:ubiquinone/menaquinone biosynthesis C-methylase UbiE|nr:methyltransferase domain-containing protein [Candidatus Kapabacteria bacterium]
MNEHQYIINSGKSGAERLKVLFETLLPGTRELFIKADINKAGKILDMGCGGGDISEEIANINNSAEIDAFDFDSNIIEIAKEKLKFKQNVNVDIKDISSDEIGTEKYDIIISRFLLSHLTSPDNALSKFKNALKDGGKIIIEDVDFDGHFCYPDCNSFKKYVEFYTHASLKRGMDPFIGRKLLYLMNKAGFTDIEMQIANPAFNTGKGKLMGILTLRNIAPTVLADKLVTEKEFAEIIFELEKFTESSDSLLSLPRIFRMIGYKR